MLQACSKLNMTFNSFKKRATILGVYKLKTRISKRVDLQEILEGKHPYFQTFKLKNRLIKAGIKKHKCEKCGIDKWNDEPIKCELHHINGDCTDHKLDNLIMLCPNCHSQTDNYTSKNNKNHKLV